jgi:hypothetical protein
MAQATIETGVQVEDTVPVQFDLSFKKETNVHLIEATRIKEAWGGTHTGGLNTANAPADIILAEDAVIPVELDVRVPVDTSIPVKIYVPANISLRETELHDPYVGLQDVVSPINWWMYNSPDSWRELIAGK